VTATSLLKPIEYHHRMDKMTKYHACKPLCPHEMQRNINFPAVFNSLAACSSLLASLSQGTMPDNFDAVIGNAAAEAGVGIRNVCLYFVCHSLTSILYSITTVSSG